MQAAAAAHAVNAAVNNAAVQVADAHGPDALAKVLEAARTQAEFIAAAAHPGRPEAVHAAAAAAAVVLASSEAGRGRQWAADAAAARAGDAVYKSARTTRLPGGAQEGVNASSGNHVLEARNFSAADAKVAETTGPSS
jgi:hypothetical protein